MKLNQLLKVGGVAFVATLGLAACSSSKSSTESSSTKNLNWQEQTELQTLDVSKVTDVVSERAQENANEGLLTLANGNTLKPGVATSYKVSKDGKTYTFNLRKSKWSDGSKVTAKDFVYGMQRTVNPKTASQYSYLLDHVQNYAAVTKKTMPVSSLGVKADGDYKLVVTLSKPQSYFKYIVSMPPLFPQSEKAVQKYGSSFGTKSSDQVYNGPYKVTGWNGSNDTWKLVRNKDYFNNKQTKLDQITFSVSKDPQTTLNEYQSGKFDVATLSGKQQVNNFKKSPELNSLPESSNVYLQLNQKNPVLRNLNVRKALSLALDRKGLTNDVLGDGSFTANGFVPTDFVKHNGKEFSDQAAENNKFNAVTYNLSAAKKYWAKGLKQLGKKKVTLTLVADDVSKDTKTTEALQSNLSKLPGLKVNNENLPAKSASSYGQSGKFDLTLSLWIADYPDPITFLQLLESNNSYNYGHWDNKQYNQYVDAAEGKDANDANKRWNDLVNAEKTLTNNVGVIPLYQQVLPQVRKDKVKGLVYSPTGQGFNFRYTSLK
ncbi:peptide ABC transporter substrate-binding protein [Lactobacillus sp. Sy-1]|uniref:peptide ABC transporter substrate-binding protein n=1 Tax=Lactobacillus sp. Sy-1 TaxID=2109645 RepID=UPI001C5A8F49|nr:peptide ABC transporter substrate-binding protein [Lactobacillus sp. Sy-1]MBW1606106.1 peptide ABC transporter substrate-binding protein [Lactobacillus sp. Sy-1]